jgi:hypothetical protein
MIHVTKADGTLQPFDREKVQRTARNLGVPQEYLEKIAADIEERLFEGIETVRILQMIHSRGRLYWPSIAYRTNLRRSIALLRSKPDFEWYVQLLLAEHGYEVGLGRIIKGRCGEHEVDAIAKKNGIVYFIEAKHHFNHHRMTGLDEGRIARAIVEDVQEGYKTGRNHFVIDKAMIVCNTKLSNHAKRYASCWGIEHIGWDNPREQNLKTMIEDTKAYPITIIKGMNSNIRRKLVRSRILMVKQLLTLTTLELSRETGLSHQKAKMLLDRSEKIME